jgi:(p)ppGpp synthase/HD superfamily hydrolase
MGMLEKAIVLAAQAHEGQKDKAGEPYILHPLRVMLALKAEWERTVAVLHDVLEDTRLKADDLAKDFPAEIIAALLAVTKRPGEPYLEFVRRAGQNPLAKRVKIADLNDNLRDERLNLVPAEAERLKAKYEKALAELGESL